MDGMDDALAREIARLGEEGLYRRELELSPLPGPHVQLDGRRCVVLCSNDYLNLSDHPRVREAARRGLESHGVGSPASRMISGTLDVHRELEARLAAFKGREEAVLFPTGYMANLAVLATLGREGDVIFSDALNHASIVDGCRLSRAAVRVFPHGDLAALEEGLAAARGADRRLVVSDAVFSMDGDTADLPGLAEAASRHGAWLVLDEAHATGVLGVKGRGIEEEFGMPGTAHVLVGTLGKALGVAGGFVTGSPPLVDLLKNRARTYLYSTAPPPPLCHALLAALDVLEAEPGRVARLRAKGRQLRLLLAERGVDVPAGDTPVVPVVLGEADRTMAVARGLRDAGFLVTGIRPPTVPPGQCRLRVTVTVDHEDADLEAFADALAAELAA